MDNSGFDMLVKVLASRRPRRTVLPVLALLGFGLAEPQEAWAAKSGKCKGGYGVCEQTS